MFRGAIEPGVVDRIERAERLDHVCRLQSVVARRDDQIEMAWIDARIENLHGVRGAAAPAAQCAREQRRIASASASAWRSLPMAPSVITQAPLARGESSWLMGFTRRLYGSYAALSHWRTQSTRVVSLYFHRYQKHVFLAKRLQFSEACP